LIEILLVVSIIGIIAPTTYMGVSSYFAQAHDLHRKKDLKDLEVVMEYYYDAATAYPSAIPPCGKPLMYTDRVILDSFPCDPTTNKPYVYITDELTQYQWYKIYTHLERNTDQSIALIGCSDGCGPQCAYNFGVASSNISVTACVFPAPHISPIPTNELTPTPQLTPQPTIQTDPTSVPTEPMSSPAPTPAFLNYVCAPGGGQPGYCEVFDDPDRSLCPFVYPDDQTCQNQCDNKDNRCKNSSGKYKPE
jgi:type II secretory pathway pseudopilin PulG